MTAYAGTTVNDSNGPPSQYATPEELETTPQSAKIAFKEMFGASLFSKSLIDANMSTSVFESDIVIDYGLYDGDFMPVSEKLSSTPIDEHQSPTTTSGDMHCISKSMLDPMVSIVQSREELGQRRSEGSVTQPDRLNYTK